MSLDIGSGSSRPYVKFNAKAGRWYIRGENDDVEIQPPTFIIDFDNIVSGWFLFREGQAPDRALDPAMGTRAQRPTPDHKRGFVVMCNSPKFFGGTVEMSSSSMHLCNAIDDAYKAYEAGKGANPGKVPVFVCTGITPSRDKFGQNFKPVLQLCTLGRPAARAARRAGRHGSAAAGTAAGRSGTAEPAAAGACDGGPGDGRVLRRWPELFTQLRPIRRLILCPPKICRRQFLIKSRCSGMSSTCFSTRCMAWSNWPGRIQTTVRRDTQIYSRSIALTN